MRVLLNPNISNTKHLCLHKKNVTFKSVKNLADETGAAFTGYTRLKELAEAKTEAQGWKVAMKMADYGNPVRHAAWTAAGAKGAAIGSMLGPVGTTVGFIAGALAANYFCNKVRNKVLDKAADFLEGE